MANEFVTRTGLIVSGSTFLPAVTTASKGYILSFDDTTKQVYYMSTSSVTVTVPGSDTQIIYNNGGAFGASSNFVFSGSNVGIGTSNPGFKLSVSGEIHNTGGYILNRSDNQGVFTGASDDLGIVHDGTNSYISNATGALIFSNPTERMRITSTGNVGINHHLLQPLILAVAFLSQVH